MRSPKPEPQPDPKRTGPPRPKVWVTGGSGFLGAQLLAELQGREWEVQAIPGSNPLPPGRHGVLRIALGDPEEVVAAAREHRPDIVIHAAAKTSTVWCEANPERAHFANVTLTRHLVEAAERIGAHFLYTSTDLVFDGRAAPYGTDAEPNPLMVYGRTKLEAERIVRAGSMPWTICRCALMYGPRAADHFSCLSWLLEGLLTGSGIELYDDEFRTPADARLVARAICEDAERRAKGIFHLGGSERLSRLAFGRLVAHAWNLPETSIRIGQLAGRRLSPPRPADVSLDSDRALRELGFVHPPVAETLADLAAMYPDAGL